MQKLISINKCIKNWHQRDWKWYIQNYSNNWEKAHKPICFGSISKTRIKKLLFELNTIRRDEDMILTYFKIIVLLKMGNLTIQYQYINSSFMCIITKIEIKVFKWINQGKLLVPMKFLLIYEHI